MSRQASTWFDPVVGLDFHLQIVLRPPIPPFVFLFPHPFIGLVFDPVGLIIGLVISNAIGAASGQEGLVGPVLVNGLPATTAGTNAWGLPILHWPYMGAWLPFPRIRPPIRPGDVVKPDLVIPPNDSIIITGSDSVFAMGASMSRSGDIGLSCSDPIRLPLSAIIAIQKGDPVLVGGGTAIDFLSAAIGVLSSRFITAPIRRWLGNRFRAAWRSPRFARLRNLWDDTRCFFTGHPVDVATGRLVTSSVDWSLRGAVPFEFKRTYSSSWSDRPSALGYGWSHSFEESVWLEWGRVVYRTGEGREIELPIPAERGSLSPDAPLFDRRNGLSLELTRSGAVTITAEDRTRRRFERTSESTWRLSAVEHPFGTTVLDYDTTGRLARLRDPAGREVELVHDAEGRLTEVRRPDPAGGPKQRIVHYKYSDEGDLTEIIDAAGRSARHEYVEHLLVRETDRDGRSFYFGYDGRGPLAYCVRTWGDGGVIDHELVYDRDARVTHVTDSLGALRSYRYDDRFLVTGVSDPDGQWTTYAHDEDGLLVRHEDPAGNVHVLEYDERGRLRRSIHPDGTTDEVERDVAGHPTKRRDRAGRTTTYAHDARGLLVGIGAESGPEVALRRDRTGQIAAIEMDGEAIVEVENGPLGLPSRARSGRASHDLSFDALGRLVALSMSTREGTFRREYEYDALDRLVHTREGQSSRTYEHDAEGNLTRERTSGGSDLAYEHGGPGWLTAVRSAGRTWQFERDTEGKLAGVVSPSGERHSIRRGMSGLPRSVETFDGRDLRYVHDPAGGASLFQSRGKGTRIRKDPRSRTLEIRYPDDVLETRAFDTDGALVRAESPTSTVVFERDAAGRPVSESSNGRRVEARRDGAGRLVSLTLPSGSRVDIERDRGGVITSVSAKTARSEPAVVKLDGDVSSGWMRRSCSGGLVISTRQDARGRLAERRVDLASKCLHRETFSWQGDHVREVRDEIASLTTRYEAASGAYVERIVGPDGRERGRFLDEQGRPHRRRDRSGRWYAPGGRLIQTEDGTSHVYDALGRLVERRGDAGVHRFEYDSADRLARVTAPGGAVTSFEYDALGRRVRKHGPSGATEYTWFGGRIVEEHGPSGTTHYLWDPDGLTLWGILTGSGPSFFLSAPHLAPEIGFDQAGRVVWKALIDLFGTAEIAVREIDVPWRFPGQYADVETGLSYNGHRYYDPSSGRYITPDPLGLVGGLDPYGYVTDPLRQIDPQGLSSYEWKRLAEWGSNAPLTLDEALAKVKAGDGIFGFGSSANMPLFERFWARGAQTPQRRPMFDLLVNLLGSPDKKNITHWFDVVARYEATWIDDVAANGGTIYFLRNPGADYFNIFLPNGGSYTDSLGATEHFSITAWESMYLATHQTPSVQGTLVNVLLDQTHAMPPP